MKKLIFLALLLFPAVAVAQQGPGQIVGGVYNASPAALADKQATSLQLDSNGSLIVAGSFSATFTNFLPTGAASLAVSSVTGRVALPNSDPTVIIQNTGTTNAFFKLGSVSVNAATTDYSIPAGYSIAIKIVAETYLAGITAADTTTFKILQGTGTPQMTGGGGSGGGGGAVTVADGADVTQGAKADAKSTATDATPVTQMQVLKEMSFMLQSPASIPAGSAIIGKVGIDQTTPGVTNAVQPVNFTPTGAATLAVTSGSARVALPDTNTTVVLQNTGSTNLFFKLGNGSVTAAVTDYSLPAGYSIAVKISTETNVAAITASSTTTLKVIQGTGTPQFAGGGGSGGAAGSLSATATEVSPSYVEGSDDALSMDLTGNLRTILPSTQLLVTGTPGSASPAVVTVQGIGGGLSLGVSAASGSIASGAVASGAFAAGSVAAGAVAAGASSFVKLEDTAAANADAGVPAMAIQKATPADTAAEGDYVMLQQSGGRQWVAANIDQINGVAPLMGAGNSGTGAQRVTISTDQPAFAVNAQPLPATTGGLSNYFVQPTASDNHVVIKAGAGQVYKIMVTNNSATVNYLRLYNATTGFNGCNSATNIVYQVAIPASTTVGGISDSWPLGMAFSTGISICVTSGYATTDTTNATASAMSVNVGYK